MAAAMHIFAIDIKPWVTGALFFLLATTWSCDQRNTTNDLSDADYAHEIETWRSERISALTQPRSWTSLVGLHWLPEGTSTFGSGLEADIKVPSHGAEQIGTWHLKGDSVSFLPLSDVEVMNFRDSTLFTGGRIRTNAQEDPHLLNLGSLYWTVISRADKYGVRVWDTLHHARIELESIPHFDVDDTWRLEATFTPADPGTTMMVDNAVGLTVPVDVAGTVHSAVGEDSFSLIAFDGGPDALFLIFSDLTTDVSTYSGGRYIYIPRGIDGTTILDLNKAFNPPCVFTDYATCLLPPEQNFIPAEVTAGEKIAGLEHG